jgi:hypothetical protein
MFSPRPHPSRQALARSSWLLTIDDPSLARAPLFHLAELARHSGRSDLAVAFARRCLSVEPQHRAARVLLDALVQGSQLLDQTS